jgi:hypothetical protein
MDKDGMAFIRLSDCEFLLEIFWIHLDTHSLVEEKVSCHPTFAGFPANLAELKHKNAGPSASQT